MNPERVVYFVSKFMETYGIGEKALSPWKRLAVTALCGGAGFALMVAAILGGALWYRSRPKPWNAAAVVAIRPAGFYVGDAGKTIDLGYVLENTSTRDFHLDSASEIQVYERTKDGILIGPVGTAIFHISVPVFVPAGQKAALLASLPFDKIPARNTAEPDAAFHERIRQFLEQQDGNLSDFVVFDGTDRYEIDLPKWLAKPPKQ